MSEINNLAPQILEVIKYSRRILLHAHPYADPDSIGSVLAMAMALKKMGKEVTAIQGDTPYPNNLSSLPSKNIITPRNYTQINPSDFDTFIILDSSSISQITNLIEIKFPNGMKTVVIDHHRTNNGFGQFNLIDQTCSSTSEILYRLFKIWEVQVDKDIALCLFMGIYADTGGFKYPNSTPDTIKLASELVAINPEYHQAIFELSNYKKPIELEMTALALSSIEKFYSDKVVFSSIAYDEVKKRQLSKSDALEGLIPDTLRTVIGWEVVASMVEAEPEVVTVSLRTRDETKYDVSLIAKNIGKNGGGHRGAAGTTIYSSLTDAKHTLLEEIKKNFKI